MSIRGSEREQNCWRFRVSRKKLMGHKRKIQRPKEKK